MKSTKATLATGSASFTLTCDCCGGSSLHPATISRIGAFWKCQTCGLLQMGTSVPRETIPLSAGRDRDEYEQRMAEIRLSRVATLTNDHRPRMLDIAQDRSPTLERALDLSWSATAAFASPRAAAAYRQRGFDVYHAPPTHLPFPTDFFDVVTAWFAIEAVSDAKAALSEWQRVLRPGGILALEAYHSHLLDRASAAKVAAGSGAPLHYCFSPRNLRSLLVDLNFELLPGPGLGRLELLGLRSALASVCLQAQSGLRRLAGRDRSFQVFCRRPVNFPTSIALRRAA